MSSLVDTNKLIDYGALSSVHSTRNICTYVSVVITFRNVLGFQLAAQIVLAMRLVCNVEGWGTSAHGLQGLQR